MEAGMGRGAEGGQEPWGPEAAQHLADSGVASPHLRIQLGERGAIYQ